MRPADRSRTLQRRSRYETFEERLALTAQPVSELSLGMEQQLQHHYSELAPAEVVNPIGCGDCLAAGIAVALSEGADMVDAVRFGMAAAAQNATDLLPARLDQLSVSEEAGLVRVKSL